MRLSLSVALGASMAWLPLFLIGQTTPVGNDLQAVLDAGDDLLLEAGQVYELNAPLVFKWEGQRIATYQPKSLSDYATLRIANREQGQLINGNHLDGVVIEQVVLDGNRYRLSSLSKEFGGPPMVFFGGKGAERQVVRRCVFVGARTWSTLKVHEGGSDVLVEDNIFFGAGADVRGNGREGTENPHINGMSWGDGISCAAQRTTVRNNVIIDPTDVGMVFFGAPGSVSEGNVIAAVARESLGGINLVDPLKFWAFEDDETRIDYRGVVINDNWIDARGGRIHVGIPVGAVPWVPSKKGFTFVGGSVTNNLISGDAAAYGIILSGISEFTITGNKSSARYSGIGEGLNPQLPPDDPTAFIMNPEVVTDCEIQPEFKKMERHISHLLRCNHLPRNSMGYRDYAYGEIEVMAVVTTAYEEMLGRTPSSSELEHGCNWLQAARASSDQFRRGLMMMPEFVARHGSIQPDQLHLFREDLWLSAFGESLGDFEGRSIEWKDAADLYREAWALITR